MKQISLGSSGLTVPAVAVGCMRLCSLSPQALNHFIHHALEHGANFFDHADIYGDGESEALFGQALRLDPSLRREDLFLQSKCGICDDYYDSSAAHILEAVDGILRRLQTDYLDLLLIHRPDALADPEEIAAAFDRLQESGKVRHFGVSNHRVSQIRLLRQYVRQPLLVDQMQLSLPVAHMIARGIEANTSGDGAADRDDGLLDDCRLHGMTIQTWSPFQVENFQASFLGNPEFPALNRELDRLAEQYGVTNSAVAAAWIFRHPANFQLIAGTTSEARLEEIINASGLTLSRPDWYRLYQAAGHPLP